jgi:hypothetical protein
VLVVVDESSAVDEGGEPDGSTLGSGVVRMLVDVGCAPAADARGNGVTVAPPSIVNPFGPPVVSGYDVSPLKVPRLLV